MKIIVYCQHVLGIGHLVRTIEICRALANHRVILVTGGDDARVPLPDHVRHFPLPGLMMDAAFNHLHAIESGKSLDQVKQKRLQLLKSLIRQESPDVLLVELYPFGRKAFRFELDPILRGIRSGELPPCRVACSLRDILVEKENPSSYESRVLETLNACFDALLVHADPGVFRLDETFARIDETAVPVVYTGFISAAPRPGAGQALRERMGIGRREKLVVGSAGGGKVGSRLLAAAVDAHPLLARRPHLCLFTGPYLSDEEYARLKSRSGPGIRVERFTSDFLSFLDAADLSLSMAGYNTCMNIMATRVPALVWPFGRNREQRMRAEKLSALGWMQVLTDEDLDPARMAERIDSGLTRESRPGKTVDLNGAQNTAAWLDAWLD